jgi:hypothetical protein
MQINRPPDQFVQPERQFTQKYGEPKTTSSNAAHQKVLQWVHPL